VLASANAGPIQPFFSVDSTSILLFFRSTERPVLFLPHPLLAPSLAPDRLTLVKLSGVKDGVQNVCTKWYTCAVSRYQYYKEILYLSTSLELSKASNMSYLKKYYSVVF
jgi:hypothetical protein